MNAYKYVQDTLSKAELLAQLAEESAELSHAALKLRRTMDDVNPPPISYEEALDNLYEEIADVFNVIGMLGLASNDLAAKYMSIGIEKTLRWADRLRGARGE